MRGRPVVLLTGIDHETCRGDMAAAAGSVGTHRRRANDDTPLNCYDRPVGPVIQ